MLKLQNVSRLIAVISYLLIILEGEMTGMPLFLWLPISVLIFGNIDQLFAFFAIAAMVVICVNTHRARTFIVLFLDVACFVLLALPLFSRLVRVPLQLFNYYAFIIPSGFFVLFYLASLYFGCKQYVQLRNNKFAPYRSEPV